MQNNLHCNQPKLPAPKKRGGQFLPVKIFQPFISSAAISSRSGVVKLL